MSKYTKEELDKLLNKEVELILGEIDDDVDDFFSFKGKIISYNIGNDNPEIPEDLVFHTRHGAIKTFDFEKLKDIKVL